MAKHFDIMIRQSCIHHRSLEVQNFPSTLIVKMKFYCGCVDLFVCLLFQEKE